MNGCVDAASTNLDESAKSAPAGHKTRRGYQKSGHYRRIGALKRRGYHGIDGRTYAGREAKRWRSSTLDQKGGRHCPIQTRLEIDAAMFDLWLILELADAIVADAKKRGSTLNRRAKMLPKLHEQYQTLTSRFAKRCEALKLDSIGLDLARRLQIRAESRSA